MNAELLKDTARKLFADDKGLLAMDESNATCNKRFAKLDIPQTVEARRAYRELIVTTPGLGESIGGVILYDETIRQQTRDGTPFLQVLAAAGIIPGIKVFGDLAGRSSQRNSGAASLGASGPVQSGRAARRIHCRDGKNLIASGTAGLIARAPPARNRGNPWLS
jgi:fructose-bisphosphate aldolase class I